MSQMIDTAVSQLNAKISGGFAGRVKFVMPGEGAIVIDATGARACAAEAEADVTMTAEPDVFSAILAGEMNPTSAYMTGKLAVDGNMGVAMQLAAALG